MAGKHRRTGIIASGVMWTGDINEEPGGNGRVTVVTEPEPALPVPEEHAAGGERAAALQTAYSHASRSPDVLAKMLAALHRI
ncbi:hypothetical protein [Saccharopolyspora hattusasensis]|uniref:hypothetical protein n=1 Tax=Saccharopolyspora hattusasensis TaxID=1128679 RepID=UPI003D96B4DF